jgi:hypothetical protein
MRFSIPIRTFLSFFILIGAAAACAGLWMVIQSIRSEHWPTTNGVVVSAEIKSHTNLHTHNAGGSSTSYTPVITCVFHLADLTYTNNRLAFGQLSSSAANAQEVINRYPVGKTVPVFYSPGNPAESVLEPGIHGGTHLCFGLGAAFILVPSLIMRWQAAKCIGG